MIDLSLFRMLLFGNKPVFPNLATGRFDDLFDDGLTMGVLYVGRAGSGKTSSLARHVVDYFKNYPDRAIFVLDWSGSITDSILKMILREPKEIREKLMKRLVYDRMGDTEWVIPLPEFSTFYGDYEDQVQRVSRNLSRLAPELVKNAPLLGGLSLQEVAPEIFRLLTAISNELGECWQITEAKKLIRDKPLLRNALAKYGHSVPNAKWWLEKVFLEISDSERELRTYALVALLGAIEPLEIRARVGYYRPGWTPKEAIDKGLLVLCDGAKLINREMTQHYLFMQVYSLIMAEINKRRPANPTDLPVSLVMDEVYSLLQIPGMAPEISKLSPQYRSRKLQLYIVLQELAQMSDELRPHIWSLGNIVCFGISNHVEAYEIAQQLFKYEPKTVKLPGLTETQNPIIEPDRGQYLSIANWIQSLPHRQCIMRRYESEHKRDPYVRFVEKTKDTPNGRVNGGLNEVKEMLLKERGVRVRDALEVINERKITVERKPPQL
jgi:hypothetical protein